VRAAPVWLDGGIMDIAEEELHALYTWVDEIPLSRPKRNIARDFSDGVLCAEVIRHYFPNLVELHNYSPANSVQQKMYNWNTLNTKVFKRLGFSLPRHEMESVANCTQGAVERVLKLIKVKMATYKTRKAAKAGLDQTDSSAATPMGTPNDVGPSPGARRETPTSAVPPAPHSSDGAAAQGDWGARSAGSVHAGQGTTAAVGRGSAREVDELRETCAILEAKVSKLETLVRLKDSKIAALTAKLQASGLS